MSAIRAKCKHDRREQLRQRLYQIALGYADCNDADRLRQDPVLKSVCDRPPQADRPLLATDALAVGERGGRAEAARARL